jgi:hypothetical protein
VGWKLKAFDLSPIKSQIMNWYLTKIVYQIICGEGLHRPQFDEQLRLIQAGVQQEAFEKAMEIGYKEEDTFRNARNEVVQWKFIGVPEVHLLANLADGAELYSRITETEDADIYVNAVHHKAAFVSKHIRHTPQII